MDETKKDCYKQETARNHAAMLRNAHDIRAARSARDYLGGLYMNKIDYDTRKAIYQKALARWGVDMQSMVAIEEMSELTKEICKIWRGNGDKENLADEIADVTIMLEQLRLMFNVNELVCTHMDAKIERLKERVQEGADK